jgi:hypothetical protein
MSYWVRVTCPCCKQTLAVGERFEEGGTYVLGGSDQAEINITYNYGKIFYEVLGGGGISTLYGMTGTAAAPVLEAALAKIPDEPPSDDYWATPTLPLPRGRSNLRNPPAPEPTRRLASRGAAGAGGFHQWRNDAATYG